MIEINYIVANHGTNNVLVFVGHGNGTYGNSKEFSIGHDLFDLYILTPISDFTRLKILCDLKE